MGDVLAPSGVDQFRSHFGGLGGCFGNPGLPSGSQRRQGGKSNREKMFVGPPWVLPWDPLWRPNRQKIEKKGVPRSTLENTVRKVLHKRCLGTPSNHENDGFSYAKPLISHFHLELQNNRKWCPTGYPLGPFGTPWASFWLFGGVLGTRWNFD